MQNMQEWASFHANSLNDYIVFWRNEDCRKKAGMQREEAAYMFVEHLAMLYFITLDTELLEVLDEIDVRERKQLISAALERLQKTLKRMTNTIQQRILESKKHRCDNDCDCWVESDLDDALTVEKRATFAFIHLISTDLGDDATFITKLKSVMVQYMKAVRQGQWYLQNNMKGWMIEV
ncbi:hypothetical protein ACFL1U_03050 [Patescibacteria group bacterium]